MVGFHRSFDYEEMRRAATAVRSGARLLATNDDATYPTPDGPIPGGGAILAGIATAAGCAPLVAGKPYEPMAALVRSLVSDAITNVVMVGDRLDTDGRFAATIGCRFALVLTGVTTAAEVAHRPGARLRSVRSGRTRCSFALTHHDPRTTGARPRRAQQRADGHAEHEPGDVGYPRHVGVGAGEELEDEPRR